MNAPAARPWRARKGEDSTEQRVDEGVAQMVLLAGCVDVFVPTGGDPGDVVEAVFNGSPVPVGTTITATIQKQTWTLMYDPIGGAQ
jgi:hypothetical protein